jgi:hypothetical protein
MTNRPTASTVPNGIERNPFGYVDEHVKFTLEQIDLHAYLSLSTIPAGKVITIE